MNEHLVCYRSLVHIFRETLQVPQKETQEESSVKTTQNDVGIGIHRSRFDVVSMLIRHRIRCNFSLENTIMAGFLSCFVSARYFFPTYFALSLYITITVELLEQ